jgi:hypothetical protein
MSSSSKALKYKCLLDAGVFVGLKGGLRPDGLFCGVKPTQQLAGGGTQRALRTRTVRETFGIGCAFGLVACRAGRNLM